MAPPPSPSAKGAGLVSAMSSRNWSHDFASSHATMLSGHGLYRDYNSRKLLVPQKSLLEVHVNGIMLCLALLHATSLQALPIVHETSGVLFVSKPPGLSFHRRCDADPGVLPVLRAMQLSGELEHPGRLYSVHRLDRVTSGLLAVAKTADAARELGAMLRARAVVKYYVALSARKPSKKQGTVRGDMARSRRGQWKLLRSTERPAISSFVSRSCERDGGPRAGPPPQPPPLRAFLLRPSTGRTHQLRVALKSLGSPVLGDPLYSAAAAAAAEERAYLHAAALRLPGSPALCEGGAPVQVVCRPTHGAAFRSAGFDDVWDGWFGEIASEIDVAGGASGSTGVWFAETVVSSKPPAMWEAEPGARQRVTR